METKEPSPPLELRPYQRAAVSAIFSAFKRGVRRQLVVMATGLGKTVVVSGMAARSGWTPGRRFFGLMHREELNPATPAQIAALQRRGYRAKSLRGITKGEAAMLFSKPVPSFLKLRGMSQRS